jgi:protein tyrosine phosphatase
MLNTENEGQDDYINATFIDVSIKTDPFSLP